MSFALVIVIVAMYFLAFVFASMGDFALYLYGAVLVCGFVYLFLKSTPDSKKLRRDQE